MLDFSNSSYLHSPLLCEIFMLQRQHFKNKKANRIILSVFLSDARTHKATDNADYGNNLYFYLPITFPHNCKEMHLSDNPSFRPGKVFILYTYPGERNNKEFLIKFETDAYIFWLIQAPWMASPRYAYSNQQLQNRMKIKFSTRYPFPVFNGLKIILILI